jgi:hypothetical protein
MKNDELHVSDLWQSLSPEEIEDACRCLLEPIEESGKKPRNQVLEALATALRFRPIFLQRKPAAENLPCSTAAWTAETPRSCFSKSARRSFATDRVLVFSVLRINLPRTRILAKYRPDGS